MKFTAQAMKLSSPSVRITAATLRWLSFTFSHLKPSQLSSILCRAGSLLYRWFRAFTYFCSSGCRS